MIISYSGGTDSTALLYQYKDSITLAVFFQYGIGLNEQEYKQAKYNCDKLGIPLRIVDISGIYKKAMVKIPKGKHDSNNALDTVVHFRNGIFISILTAIAEEVGARTIALAIHNALNPIHPDCGVTFLGSMKDAVKRGTIGHVKLLVPYELMTKREVVAIGVSAGMAIEHTYSCYVGDEEECGECPACIDKKEVLDGF